MGVCNGGEDRHRIGGGSTQDRDECDATRSDAEVAVA